MPTADSLDYLARKAALANEYAPHVNTNTAAGIAAASQQPIKIGRQPLAIDYTAVAKNEALKPAETPAAADATSQPPAVVGNAYSLESDPVYQAAMASGQSQFNAARAAAMANKNTQEMQLSNERRNLDLNATEARRRTAGNYAARGMAGGAAGALTLAEMQANAKQITAQTDIKDQIASLNQNYLENYGNQNQAGYDWTGTLIGQNYKTQAAQNALTAQLAKMGIQ